MASLLTPIKGIFCRNQKGNVSDSEGNTGGDLLSKLLDNTANDFISLQLSHEQNVIALQKLNDQLMTVAA